MKSLKTVQLLLSLALIAFAYPSAALAQDKDIASVSGSGSAVRFELRTTAVSTTLTIVSPDGRSYTTEFKGGTNPEFSLGEVQGEKLPDGQYSYELRVNTGTKATRGRDDEPEKIRAARKSAPIGVAQSGGFAVVNGSVVMGGVEEGSRAAAPATPQPVRLAGAGAAALAKIRQRHHVAPPPDQVIPDDLIVQGSACVGLDCVNGEVFGFDSLRLKENNTRLQFDDTSTSAGFPTNNWQIRANDSGGGTSFLGFVDQGATGNSETGTIVFRTDAGAPANSLRVASNGKVGLRTATPVLDVHANTSDTPAIRLEQNNTGGFSAQTWDIAGNEANFFVRDVTSGSRLPFRIRPGAPTSSIDISASGNVGIGTASPSGLLHASSNAIAGTSFFFQNTDTGGKNWRMLSTGSLNTGGAGIFGIVNATDDSNNYKLMITPAGNVGIATNAPTDTLSVNGTASKPGGGSWAVFSDERLKNIKGQFGSGLRAVMQLQPLRYAYKPDNALNLTSDEEYIGFGAQALQKVIPEAVTTNGNGYLQVNNDPIIWTMLNAIKEQQQQIEELKTEVRRLRKTSRQK